MRAYASERIPGKTYRIRRLQRQVNFFSFFFPIINIVITFAADFDC